MRIFHVVFSNPWDSRAGGAHTVCHRLAIEMSSLGHETHVLYSGVPIEYINNSSQYYVHSTPYREVLGVHLECFEHYSYIKNIVKNRGIDIIFLHGENGLFLHWTKRLDVRVEAIFHAACFPPLSARFPSQGWRNIGESINHMMLKKALKGCQRIHVFSKFAKQLATNGLDKPTPPFNDVSPGIDSSWCDLDFRPRKLTSGTLKIISWGRLEFIKGFDILLESLAIVRSKGIKCELMLVGLGSEEESLRRLSDKLGLSNSIHFLGRKTHAEIQQILMDTDLAIFPSRRESFGLAVAEALGSGIPVIAASNSSITEVLGNGKFGTLTPTENILELSNAIVSFQKSPEPHVVRAAIAKKSVRDRFSWKACAEKILS